MIWFDHSKFVFVLSLLMIFLTGCTGSTDTTGDIQTTQIVGQEGSASFLGNTHLSNKKFDSLSLNGMSHLDYVQVKHLSALGNLHASHLKAQTVHATGATTLSSSMISDKLMVVGTLRGQDSQIATLEITSEYSL